MKCGRSRGVLQTNREASICALACGLSTYTGLAVRQAPAYSYETQERYRSTLWQQVRTLREGVKNKYGGYHIKAYDGVI